MAKRTVSFADYEEPTWEEYTGEDPPAGKWFTAKVTRAKYDSEGDSVMFIAEITDGDYKGWGRAWYGDFEGERKWKMHSMLKALQGGQTKDVTLDWENDKAVAAWLAKQKPIRIKTGEYNDRITINRVSPLLEAVPAPGKAAPAVAEPEPDGDGEAEDYTEAELMEMSATDLEEILTEEFDVPEEELPEKPARDRGGVKYKKALVEAILDEQEGEDEEEGEDGDDPDEGDGDDEFNDGFDDDEPEPEPEPEPAPTRRRRGAAAPAKAAPAKAAEPAATTRRRRR